MQSYLRSLTSAMALNLALVVPAHAQAADLPAPQAPSASGFSMPDGIRVTLGASILYMPKYESASSYVFSALPIFKLAPIGAGGALGALSNFDAKNLDDISLAVVNRDGFEFGPLAGLRYGRAEKDSPRLRGLGDIDGGLVAGAFVKYGAGPYFVRGSLHQHVTGDDTGLIVRLAAGSHFMMMPRLLVKAEASLDFADNAYMDAYFGVSALQSARSGLRTFDAGAGAKSASVTLATEYALTPDWTLLASAGYTRLLGDAADSPIVEQADRFDVKLGVSRAFDWKLR